MLRRAILILAVVALVAGLAGTWLLWGAAGPETGPHRVTVEEGATLASVAGQLEQQGAIPGDGPNLRLVRPDPGR